MVIALIMPQILAIASHDPSLEIFPYIKRKDFLLNTTLLQIVAEEG